MTLEPPVSFDPVAAYRQASNDLVTLVNTFGAKDSALTPREFLSGVTSIGERLRIVSLVMITGALATVMDKIPQDEMDHYREQADLDRLMESPEQQRERMKKQLKNIADSLNPPTL